MDVFLCANKNYSENPDLTLFNTHTHDNYEIFCFISGDAKYYVEGNIYDLRPSDILIIKKAEAHSLLINKPTPYTRYVVNFNAAALLGDAAERLLPIIDAKPLGKFNSVLATDTQKNSWLYYLNKIVRAEDENEKRLYLTVLLNELCENIEKSENLDFNDVSNDKIIDYINEKLMEIKTLDEICEHFYISKTHLNRRFKALTGSTVWNYIVTKRLIFAKDLLLQGRKPREVSEICGYDEYSSFFRAYKLLFGVSPKEDYRG